MGGPMKHLLLMGVCGAVFCGAATANELRVGVLLHNVPDVTSKNANKEDGPNVHLEYQFAPLESWTWLLKPAPYVTGSLNLAGETSYGGAGLNWDWDLSQNWEFEFGLGYVFHNGETTNPFAPGDPRATEFSDENVLLGSEDLFRLSWALNYDINERWQAQAIYTHLSHGHILGEERNQGLNEIGVRAVYRFGR